MLSVNLVFDSVWTIADTTCMRLSPNISLSAVTSLSKHLQDMAAVKKGKCLLDLASVTTSECHITSSYIIWVAVRCQFPQQTSTGYYFSAGGRGFNGHYKFHNSDVPKPLSMTRLLSDVTNLI